MSDTPVAIVTGASSGIGCALAEQLAERGYRVALAARTEVTLRELATRLGEEMTSVHPCDVGDPEQASALVGNVVGEFGRIDVLANVAGMALLKPIAETDLSDWRRVMDVNATSAFVTTRAAWPTFASQKSGFVVNVSSMASGDPFPGFGAYAAAKAAVNLLTRMTAIEGEKIGLRAVCIAPGAVETPMLRSMFSEKMIPPEKALSPQYMAELITGCLDGTRPFDPGETLFVTRD